MRLVDGGARRRPHVTIAPPSRQPFPVDALILEEDTWLALSADPEIHEPVVHPVRTMTEAWEAQPTAPGSILVRPGVPLRILAVVHDLSMAPSWREEWIHAALRSGLAEAQRRGLSVLGIEPLGAVHGRFPPPAFDALLRELLESEAAFLKAIWRIDRRPLTSDQTWLLARERHEREMLELARRLLERDGREDEPPPPR